MKPSTLIDAEGKAKKGGPWEAPKAHDGKRWTSSIPNDRLAAWALLRRAAASLDALVTLMALMALVTLVALVTFVTLVNVGHIQTVVNGRVQRVPRVPQLA